MASFISLVLLLLTHLCQWNEILSSSPWTAEASPPAFLPRGGASIGRGGGANEETVGDSETLDDPECNATDVDGGEFDLEKVGRQLRKEEVAEIKKSQEFLKKQQRRRELDKTWLDKGITAVIEFFENLFRWEVIEV